VEEEDREDQKEENPKKNTLSVDVVQMDIFSAINNVFSVQKENFP